MRALALLVIVVAADPASAQSSFVSATQIKALRQGMDIDVVVGMLGAPQARAAVRCRPLHGEPGACITYSLRDGEYQYVSLDFQPGPDGGPLLFDHESWHGERAAAGSSLTAAARRLEEGLSAAQVEKLLGDPALTSQGSCGGAPGVKRWRCRTWTYESDGRVLRVLFQESRGTWVINSWDWT